MLAIVPENLPEIKFRSKLPKNREKSLETRSLQTVSRTITDIYRKTAILAQSGPVVLKARFFLQDSYVIEHFCGQSI
jgi:hypothetical protein